MHALARLSRLVSLVAVIAAPLGAQVFQGSLTKPAAFGDTCGYAIAVDGDWAFASKASAGGYSGEVRTYLRGATGFTHTQTLVAPVLPTVLSHFGNAMAADAGFLAVGAPLLGPGRVYIYKSVAGSWVEFQNIGLPSFAEGSSFGSHLELVGDRLLVRQLTAGAGAQPRIQIWKFDGVLWQFEQAIDLPAAPATNYFGWSMALEGGLIAIADSGGFAGRAYVYRHSGSSWNLEAVLTAPAGTTVQFASSVVLNGGRVLVAATEAGSAAAEGGVYVFEPSGHAWTFTQHLSSVSPHPNWATVYEDGSMAASGDWVAVGFDTYVVGVHYYAVELYHREGSSYVLRAHLPAPSYGANEQFGRVLAFGDGTLAVRGTHENGSMQVVTFDASQLGTTLQAWPATISVSSGGEQALALDAGAAHTGDVYFVLGSLSGTAPGIPIGALTLPLNLDAYLVLTLQQAGPITPALGVLGAFGAADASIALPAGSSPSLAGLVAHHAYVVLSPSTLDVELASNPVVVTLVP